jgi:hypothetical protein
MTLPTIRRPDFNPSLVHLTRERVERPPFPENGVTRIVKPFEVLKEILTSGVLKGSGNDGYVYAESGVLFGNPALGVEGFISNRALRSSRREYFRSHAPSSFTGTAAEIPKPARRRARFQVQSALLNDTRRAPDIAEECPTMRGISP